MPKPWERQSTWRSKTYEFYDNPQPVACGLTDEELALFYKGFLMDDKPWSVAGELLAARRVLRDYGLSLNEET